MAIDTKPNDFQTKVSNSINQTADEAQQRMLEKEAEYDAAMKQLSIFQHKVYNLKSQLKSGATPELQAKYNNMVSLFNNAEMNTDVLRFSLQSRIAYCRKMNTSAAFANSYLA